MKIIKRKVIAVIAMIGFVILSTGCTYIKSSNNTETYETQVNSKDFISKNKDNYLENEKLQKEKKIKNF